VESPPRTCANTICAQKSGGGHVGRSPDSGTVPVEHPPRVRQKELTFVSSERYPERGPMMNLLKFLIPWTGCPYRGGATTFEALS
jgi:hypothetical protein